MITNSYQEITSHMASRWSGSYESALCKGCNEMTYIMVDSDYYVEKLDWHMSHDDC